MNRNLQGVDVNSLVDKHPFHTITLVAMVVGAMLVVYGILYVALWLKK
jgi:uncharacterized membrane protein HdeD (DUF308 family)